MVKLRRCHSNKANARHVQLVNHGHTFGKGVLEKGCTQGHANNNTSHTCWMRPVPCVVDRNSGM